MLLQQELGAEAPPTKAMSSRHEPTHRIQPRTDLVPALVPDSRRAVLDLSATAATRRAGDVRYRCAGAVGRCVRGQHPLVARQRKRQSRQDLAAGAGGVAGLRRVARSDDAGVLRASRVVARSRAPLNKALHSYLSSF